MIESHLILCDWPRVGHMCEICYHRSFCLPAKQCVSSTSAHSLCVSVSHFRLLNWEIATFISSGMWLQHPDLNPVNYEIYIDIQQQVCLRKIHNMNGPIL